LIASFSPSFLIIMQGIEEVLKIELNSRKCYAEADLRRGTSNTCLGEQKLP